MGLAGLSQRAHNVLQPCTNTKHLKPVTLNIPLRKPTKQTNDIMSRAKIVYTLICMYLIWMYLAKRKIFLRSVKIISVSLNSQTIGGIFPTENILVCTVVFWSQWSSIPTEKSFHQCCHQRLNTLPSIHLSEVSCWVTSGGSQARQWRTSERGVAKVAYVLREHGISINNHAGMGWMNVCIQQGHQVLCMEQMHKRMQGLSKCYIFLYTIMVNTFSW